MKLFYYISILLVTFSCVHIIESNEKVNNTDENEFLFLKQKYTEMDKGIKSIIKGSLKSVIRIMMEAGQQLNISNECMGNGMKLAIGLRDLKAWALSFPDASGKIGDGLMSGSSQMLGNYDQCLNSTAKKKNGDIDFRGRYCLLSFRPYLPDIRKTPDVYDRVKIVEKATQNLSEAIRFFIYKGELMRYLDDNFGLCVPSGCNTDDVAKFSKYAGDMVLMNLTLHYCHTEESLQTLNTRKIVIICIFSFIGLLAMLGTFLDHYSKRRNFKFENTAVQAVICFSITSNFQKVISTNITDKTLACLSGVRVLALFHIILGHLYVTKFLVFSVTNFVSMALSFPTYFFQIVSNGFLTVDTFFLLGGFINSYIRVKQNITTPTCKSILMLIVHRLWRLYPAYIFSILLSLLFTSRGPMSSTHYERVTDHCVTEWWKNLLFINNFYDQTHLCFPHSWYVACDMQYFLISLFTIPILMRKPKTGILVNLAVIIFGIAFTVGWTWIKDIPPSFIMIKINQKDLTNVANEYTAPYGHIASYFIGILLGFLLANKKDFKIPKIYQLLGWALSSVVFTVSLYLLMWWYEEKGYTAIESALFFSLSKPLFAMSVGWIVFCCITGHGGVVNYILSLKIWIPLARLSFMAYLISFPLQLFYLGNVRTTIDVHRMRMIWTYAADITISLLLALPMVVFTESPFLALEKLTFPQMKTSAGEKVNNMKEKELQTTENNSCDIEKIKNILNLEMDDKLKSIS